MKTIHLVSHTHWDREWYRPFQYFRIRLVHVLDRVMEILENDSRYRSFLLDGQSVPLEDYLQVKPEQYSRLQDLIRAERLVVGPWYVQPDEFAPDGESLIRNLQIGTEIAEKFGRSMMIGYLPDSFGQSGQMPHILAGFGIDCAVVMRGVPEEIETCEFTWEGINGDRVLAISLPNGYSNAMFLPEDSTKGKLRIKQAVLAMKKWTAGDHILLMNGVDHQFPQAFVPDLIENLNRSGKKERYVHSTLEEYIHAVKESTESLPVQQGEMISPCKHRVHTSIASTRIYQKQKNRQMEAMLEKYVEPLASLAWLLGADYPQDLIRQAWKTLLQNQTHDGLCGCCTDEVHGEMDQRFLDVKNMGKTLLKSYSRAIACKLDTNGLALIAFNNAMTRNTQIVRAAVYVKHENFALFDDTGSNVPYQIEQVEEVDIAQLSIWSLYTQPKTPMKKVHILFQTRFESSVGYKVFTIHEKKAGSLPQGTISVKDNSIENQFFRIEINSDGSLDVFDKQTQFQYRRLHTFEDVGDAGDTYNYCPVENGSIITSDHFKASFEILQQGPLSVSIKIHYEMPVPERLEQGDTARTQTTVPLQITSTMTLYRDVKRLDFITEINNNAYDHRVRVLFPSGIASSHSEAETQFGTITRPNHISTHGWKSKGWKEKPLPIYSLQRFVDLHDSRNGLAVLNRGLSEYEIYDDSVIALTLVRGVGWMGKRGLAIRPGRPSGISTETPQAQCTGKNVLEYALLPHAGNTDTGNIPQSAAEFDAPSCVVQNKIYPERVISSGKLIGEFLQMESLTTHIADPMRSIKMQDENLFTLSHEKLVGSAFKKAEVEDAFILRFYNSSAVPIPNATISCSMQIRQATLVNFKEETIAALEVAQDGCIQLPEVKAYSAMTIKINI